MWGRVVVGDGEGGWTVPADVVGDDGGEWMVGAKFLEAPSSARFRHFLVEQKEAVDGGFQ